MLFPAPDLGKSSGEINAIQMRGSRKNLATAGTLGCLKGGSDFGSKFSLIFPSGGFRGKAGFLDPRRAFAGEGVGNSGFEPLTSCV